MAKKDNRNDVLIEDLIGKFDFLVEITASVKEKVDRLPLIELEISQIKADIKVIKAAAITTNRKATSFDERLTELEAKPA